MPSHASHLIFALRLAGAIQPGTLDISALNRGAQAPDMFYHNRRTKPSGLYVSGAMHRRGFGSLAARLIARSQTFGRPGSLFALGFVSHAVLDRYLHPFINYRTAWEGLEGHGGGAYRYQHTLCERFVDLWSAHHFGFEWTLRSGFAGNYGPHPRFDTAGIAEVSEFDDGTKLHAAAFPDPGLSMLAAPLGEIYPKCKNDEFLAQRFANAWRDSRGYYHWTSNIAAADYLRERDNAFAAWQRIRADKEEEDDDGALRFAAIVHPQLKASALSLPDLDPFNLSHNPWHDPCAKSVPRVESLPELWDMAEKHAGEIFNRLAEIGIDLRSDSGWTGAQTEPESSAAKGTGTSFDPGDTAAYEMAVERIRNTLGSLLDDGDLRSFSRSGEGCDVDSCSPVDWFEVWFKMEGLI